MEPTKIVKMRSPELEFDPTKTGNCGFNLKNILERVINRGHHMIHLLAFHCRKGDTFTCIMHMLIVSPHFIKQAKHTPRNDYNTDIDIKESSQDHSKLSTHVKSGGSF